jgi:peptidoglycan/LPS O-acetylase OafA/YrhL
MLVTRKSGLNTHEYRPMTSAQQAPSLSGNANNFDVLRFLFASLVVLSHSYPLGEGTELREPLWNLTGQTTLGGLSVHCFFIISGFLIAASWERRKTVGQFLKKRVLRIYPGFIIANAVGVFLIAPMAADSAIVNLGVSLQQFTWDCLRLQGTQLPDTLFPQNHLHAVNGSIWSIAYEFWCYIGVIVLGLVPLFHRRSFVVGLFVASLAVAFIFPTYHLEWFGGGILGKIFGYPFFWARLLPNYLAGVAAWRYREKIVVSDRVAMVSAMALALSVPVANSWSVMFPVCGTYLVLWAAFHPSFKLHGFSKHGDFSYGMYLYAFPIQQLLVMSNSGSMSPYALFAAAWPLSVLAGMLSWFIVERPFLRRARSAKPEQHGESYALVAQRPSASI